MESLTAMLSHVCGQGRCFVVNGAALPVCQRCLGLYAGAALTGLWLAASGAWRGGLPTRATGWLNSLVLLAAMLGGLHLPDGTATWRLLCGLWTGHVAVLWLVGAAVQIQQPSLPGQGGVRAWSKGQSVQALLAASLLTLAAIAFAAVSPAGWYLWTALSILGMLCLLLAVSIALATVAMRLVYLSRQWTKVAL